MTKRLLFTLEAEEDIAGAYSWYESREQGVGEDFLRCIWQCLETIQRNPQMYRIAVDEFRRALIRRFPFEVFYEATDESIVVYSVFHCAQNPAKWRKRLGLDE